MFEKYRMFFKVLRAVMRDRSFFEDVRTIAFETRENRARIAELKAEFQRVTALIQELFQELKALRQEMLEAREYGEQERQKILLRLEQIEQGLPFDTRPEEEADAGWVM
ncbi:MAG TPA: hypothetical protein VFZ34_18420 [Blastocatellia bacterium]|nr:hypothetical protein [Blastocatellia bacterium]